MTAKGRSATSTQLRISIQIALICTSALLLSTVGKYWQVGRKEQAELMTQDKIDQQEFTTYVRCLSMYNRIFPIFSPLQS